MLIHPAALAARLGGCKPAVSHDNVAPVPPGFVRQLAAELVATDIRDGLRQMVVLQQAGHVEVVNHHDCLGFRQSTGELLQRVRALIRHFPILRTQATRGLFAVLAALLLARDRAVQALELLELLEPLLQAALQVARILPVSPSDRVARHLMPRSTPTTGPVFFGTTCSCATHTETYQWPACSETVAESSLTPGVPGVGRNRRSLRRKRPRRGNWIASGNATMEPVSRKPPKPRFLLLRLG